MRIRVAPIVKLLAVTASLSGVPCRLSVDLLHRHKRMTVTEQQASPRKYQLITRYNFKLQAGSKFPFKRCAASIFLKKLLGNHSTRVMAIHLMRISAGGSASGEVGLKGARQLNMEFPHDNLAILASGYYSTAITRYINTSNGAWKD